MAKIRPSNLKREELDKIEEVQRAFNDVYRILREHQQEIDDAAKPVQASQPVSPLPAPVAPAQPAPATKRAKRNPKKES